MMIDVGRRLELAARRRVRHHPVREFLYGDGFLIGAGLTLIVGVVTLIGVVS